MNKQTFGTENNAAAAIRQNVQIEEAKKAINAAPVAEIILINAFCDCCPNNASADKSALQSAGWFLGNREQFCPACNF